MSKKIDSVMEGIYSQQPGFLNNVQITDEVVTERMYVRVLSELCMNRFKWEGLPKGVDERFLEMELFRRALCVFFKDKTYERYFALRGAPAGRWNMYDNPTSYIVTGNGMIQRTLAGTSCVPIWSNYMRVPDLDIVFQYAKKLARIDRTIDIIVQQLRSTTIIFAKESQRLSWQNVMRQHTEGQPYIVLTDDIQSAFDNGAVSAFDSGGHPDKLPKLLEARNQMWSQAMGLLGINNANTDKRERLASNEVDANNEQVGAMRNVVMNAREQAVAQINEKYGLEVKVSFNTEVLALAETMSGQMNIENDRMGGLYGA